MIQEITAALCFLLPSFPTRTLYRLAGYSIGQRAKMPLFSYVYAKAISIGNDVEIRSFVFIRVRQLSIGENTIVSFGTQIKGVSGFFTKGCNFIGVHCLINCEKDVKLGFYSGMGPRCTLYTHGSFLPVTKGYPAKFQEVVLEDYVWVGMEVTILPGTHIQPNCIINPGIVVPSRVKGDTILEIKNGVVREIDLKRIQLFTKKDNSFYFNKIINEFAGYYFPDREITKDGNHFRIDHQFIFNSIPEQGLIELTDGTRKKIVYNLDEFYTTNATSKIHKQFLFFLRRRYGVILRTQYR